MRPLQLAGMRFGRLYVVGREPNKLGRTMWKCVCDCGNTHVANGKLMKQGHTKSCGCLKHDGSARIIHGHSKRSGHSRTYRSWAKMLERCENPKNKDYYNYGGRGITVHASWHAFEDFLSYIGECPEKFELDRIDSNKSYEPGNVRWVDEYTQALNRTCILWVVVNGVKIPMKEAAKHHGLSYSSLKHLTAKNGLYKLSAQAAIDRLLISRRK